MVLIMMLYGIFVRRKLLIFLGKLSFVFFSVVGVSGLRSSAKEERIRLIKGKRRRRKKTSAGKKRRIILYFF
jgi:hypothetical protein